MKDDHGNYPYNRFDRGYIHNLFEFYHIRGYTIDYQSCFQMPPMPNNIKNRTIELSSTSNKLFDFHNSNRFETESATSSVSMHSHVTRTTTGSFDIHDI